MRTLSGGSHFVKPKRIKKPAVKRLSLTPGESSKTHTLLAEEIPHELPESAMRFSAAKCIETPLLLSAGQSDLRTFRGPTLAI